MFIFTHLLTPKLDAADKFIIVSELVNKIAYINKVLNAIARLSGNPPKALAPFDFPPGALVHVRLISYGSHNHCTPPRTRGPLLGIRE